MGQSHTGKHNIKATVKDDSLKLSWPLIVTEPDVDSQAEAERKAKKRLADSRLEGLTITAVVQGHRTDDGTLWHPPTSSPKYGLRPACVAKHHGYQIIGVRFPRALKLAHQFVLPEYLQPVLPKHTLRQLR